MNRVLQPEGWAKPRGYANGIVARIAGVDSGTAERALAVAGGDIKPAVLLCAGVADVTEARALLRAARGNLRRALAGLPAS